MSSVVVILPKIVTLLPNKVIIIYKHGVKTEVEQVCPIKKEKSVIMSYLDPFFFFKIKN